MLISEELLAEARRLYASGLSLRQVAAELHQHRVIDADTSIPAATRTSPD